MASEALLAVMLLASAPDARNPFGGPCGPRSTPDSVLQREAAVMGTRLRVLARSGARAESAAAIEAVVREIERMDGLLSTWDPNSPISRVNLAPVGAAVPAPRELVALLEEVGDWAAQTSHAFDPTVGALVDAYDLRGRGRWPRPEEIAHALEGTGRGAFRLDRESGEITRTHPRAWIDTGAFGKGAALRSARTVLQRSSESRVLVDLGGQIVLAGATHEPWPIAVAHPARRRESVGFLCLGRGSVATSGNSERTLHVDGGALGHVLDPRDGRPVPPWGSVTVVAPDPLVADVLATALFVLGPKEGMRRAEGLPEVGVLFLESQDLGVAATWNEPMTRWLAEGWTLPATSRERSIS